MAGKANGESANAKYPQRRSIGNIRNLLSHVVAINFQIDRSGD
jgi:hypothetical protein